MPEFGPSSTPQHVLENQYRQLQQKAADWEKGLQSQGLDEQSYAEAIQDMQEQLNEQVSQFQAKANQLQQTRSMADAGLMDEQAATRANWEAVLPDEVLRAMYPKQPEVSKREPFSTKEVLEFGTSIEKFAEKTKAVKTKQKKYGAFGWDWTKKDVANVRSQAAVMKQYRAWKQFIGYSGFTPTEKRQVDGEWDNWISEKGGDWKWDTGSKTIKAERAGGPLTRAFGSQFRQTPTGPGEATNPFQDSIKNALPKKKKQPTAEELRSEGTQESYELGKGLGYWN